MTMMHTRHFLLFTILALPVALHAQQAASTFGIKAGVNMSNLYIDDVEDENARFGFHAGVFGRAAASDAIGIQAELLYSTKGTTIVWDGLIDQEVTFNLGYLDLPVFVVFRLGDAIELHAGGYAGLLLASDVSTSGDLGSDSEDLDKDNFNSMDYGLVGGLGVNLGPVQIGARYNYGLAQLAKSDGAELVLGDAKNSVGQLYIAFGLGGE